MLDIMSTALENSRPCHTDERLARERTHAISILSTVLSGQHIDTFLSVTHSWNTIVVKIVTVPIINGCFSIMRVKFVDDPTSLFTVGAPFIKIFYILISSLLS